MGKYVRRDKLASGFDAAQLVPSVPGRKDRLPSQLADVAEVIPAAPERRRVRMKP